MIGYGSTHAHTRNFPATSLQNTLGSRKPLQFMGGRSKCCDGLVSKQISEIQLKTFEHKVDLGLEDVMQEKWRHQKVPINLGGEFALAS